jgi:DNA-binding response OmpR family regulator
MAKPSIVVVEDDQPTAEFLSDFLDEEGYSITACLNAEQAFETVQRGKLDLLILDLHLKGSESGFAVLDMLRFTPSTKDVPVIVCSADRKFLRDNEEALQLGKCVVLEKPFDLDVLLNMVNAALSVPKERASIAARAEGVTLRATKRLQPQPEPAIERAFVLPRTEIQFVEPVQVLSQKLVPPVTDAVDELVQYTQQLGGQSEALCAEAQALRTQTAQILLELKATCAQIDTRAWMQALSGAQPR